MATKTKPTTRHPPRHPPDTYMKLIRRFPLKPIKDDTQHDTAVELIGELIGHDLDDGASAYLDTLILLTSKYEDDRHSPTGIALSPQQALLAIMSTNGLTQTQIGKIIGSESAVSMFLNGQRDLSKSHIKALAERFHIDATLFL